MRPAIGPAINGAGFTLLEVLVSLVVLGFILVGLNQGVHFGLLATDVQARSRAATGDLDAVDRTLRRLIAEADPGNDHSGATMRGTSGSLAFISDLPAAAAGVTRHADIVLAVDPAHRLVLRWRPHAHAPSFAPPPAPVDTGLIDGVERVELSYWSDGWQRDWTRETLPALVRLRVVFPKGDGRHWPDIVMAPLRHRPGG